MGKKRSINIIRNILIVTMIIGAYPLAKYSYVEYRKYTIISEWKKDIELYKRGIEKNIPQAIFGLAYAYHTGHGVEKNHKKARELYQQAADGGEMLAQYNLGFMYHNGEGGDKDIEKALYYYQQAADQDYYIALVKLSIIYSQGDEVVENLVKAKELKKRGLKNLGKSLSYEQQFKQVIKYQLGKF